MACRRDLFEQIKDELSPGAIAVIAVKQKAKEWLKGGFR
jgi:hypothetical protein